MNKIAIIGAGVTGVTTAYELASRGFDVTVFDKHRYAAMETSLANGGQLSASNAEVWTHPSTVRKGLTWLFAKDAPLAFNMRPSLHKYSWLAEFVLNFRNYRSHTIETTRLAIEARRHLFAIAEREGIDFDLHKRGILHLYRDRAGFAHAESVNRLLVAGGLERYPVTAKEMRDLEPTLVGDYFGGFFTPGDATGDIHKFTTGLSQVCERQGVQFRFETAISHIAPTTGSNANAGYSLRGPFGVEVFDSVVICAGTHSNRFARQLGDRLNIYPVKGYSITVALDDPLSQSSAPTVSLLDDARKIVSSRLGVDRFRVAGTAEFNGMNFDIRSERIAPLVNWTRELFPGVDTEHVVPWAGLRPMTPSMMPKVGPGRRPGVFYNTGHGHLGWTLSAVTAHQVAAHADTYRGGAHEARSPRAAVSAAIPSR